VTRFSVAANATAAGLAHVPYVMFADFDFASGHIRVNSSDREISFGSNAYIGLGQLVGIGPVKETADLSADRLDFSLSHVPNSTMADTLTQTYHGRSASLYVGYLSESGALVGTPHLLWEGRMDSLKVRTEEGSSIINLVCENRLVLWNKPAGWLYTHEHQREFDVDDLFFNQVSSLPNKIAKWGEETVQTGRRGGGGRPGGRQTREQP
jgi:hypothetical protein